MPRRVSFDVRPAILGLDGFFRRGQHLEEGERDWLFRRPFVRGGHVAGHGLLLRDGDEKVHSPSPFSAGGFTPPAQFCRRARPCHSRAGALDAAVSVDGVADLDADFDCVWPRGLSSLSPAGWICGPWASGGTKRLPAPGQQHALILRVGVYDGSDATGHGSELFPSGLRAGRGKRVLPLRTVVAAGGVANSRLDARGL